MLDPKTVTTAHAADVPQAIVDFGTVTSDLLSSATGTVVDVDVVLTSLVHTYVGDLEVELIHPDGTVILLARNRGGAGMNFTGTRFDDAAGVSITTIGELGAPFTGSFRPEMTLSALNGKSAQGTWRLRVRDEFAIDVGSLDGWALILATGEQSLLTDARGTYAFSNLPPGMARVRVLPAAGWVVTHPVGALHTVTVNSSSLLNGRCFGLASTTIRSVPQISALSRDPHGRWTVRGRGAPLQPHRVQGRTSLTGGTWNDIGITTPDSAGEIYWEDVRTDRPPPYFLRLVVP
jgi:subtilisin-like proprotein convertase family protein